MNDRRFLEEQAAKLQAPFLVDYDKLEVLRKKFSKCVVIVLKVYQHMQCLLNSKSKHMV